MSFRLQNAALMIPYRVILTEQWSQYWVSALPAELFPNFTINEEVTKQYSSLFLLFVFSPTGFTQ